jgi:hypothetical protein
MPDLDFPRITGILAHPTHIRRGVFDRYWSFVRMIRPTSLLAYWPMWDFDHYYTYDLSLNRFDASATTIQVGTTGLGDGHQSCTFDGGTDYCNIYSAGLAAAFNGAEGTLAIWAKVSGAGIWTDGVQHEIVNLRADENNRVYLYKLANNQLHWRYSAGGTTKSVSLLVTPTDWFHMAITWSKTRDRVRAFYQGAQTGTSQTGLGTWVGSLNSSTSVIGAYNLDPLAPWSGYLCHAAIWSAELTPGEIKRLSRA